MLGSEQVGGETGMEEERGGGIVFNIGQETLSLELDLTAPTGAGPMWPMSRDTGACWVR